MDKRTVSIRFPDLELGEAGKAARSLREALLDETKDVELSVEKDDPTTQDFGATLIAVLGTPAILVVARGIAYWIAKRPGTVVVEIDGRKTTFTSSGPVDENARKIVESLTHK